MELLLPLAIAILLLGGLGVALLGAVKVPLAEKLHIDEARVGGLMSLFGFAMIPVIFVAGFLTDELGPRLVIVLGSLLYAASLITLGAGKQYSMALVGVVGLSAAWSLLINVGNVLTLRAFPGSPANATNLANVFFGLGAFLTPLYLTWLVRRTSLTLALICTALAALTPAALVWGADLTPSAAAAPGSSPTSFASSLLGDPLLWLCGLALFFYAPIEASLGGWTTTLLGERGVSEGTAAAFLSSFWLAFMGGRLATALLLPKDVEPHLIVALGLTASAVLSALVLTGSKSLTMFLVPLAGFVLGPVFPTIMAILLSHFPAELHGRAVGLFFAIGGAGWTAIPMLIGAYARRTSIQKGLRITVAAALGLTLIGGLLFVQRKAPDSTQKTSSRTT